MKKLELSMHQEIAAGPLVGVSSDGDVWRFEFKNQLAIEALGGWRVFEPVQSYRQRTLMGHRDIADRKDGVSQLMATLSGLELVFLHFNQMSEWLDLIFMDSELERKVHMQLYKTSALDENWRIIGEDFTDSDKLGIIEGSIPQEQETLSDCFWPEADGHMVRKPTLEQNISVWIQLVDVRANYNSTVEYCCASRNG